MYVHMPVFFKEWDEITPNKADEMRRELYLFPEIDPRIVQKTQTMMEHTNWNSL
jgi:hypothetical protein